MVYLLTRWMLTESETPSTSWVTTKATVCGFRFFCAPPAPPLAARHVATTSRRG